MARRQYMGAAVTTTLSSSINNTTTAIPISASTGWPDGSGSTDFYIVIDPDETNEEKILCDSRSGLTITAVAGTGRGADGTSAATHSAGAVVKHVFTATDANDANAHIFDTTRDDHTQLLNTARHAATSHATATLADGSVTYAKLEASQRWEPGDMKMTARTTAPTGWLICNGAAVSRTTYADLFTAISTTYGVGDGSTTFNLPDLRQRFPMGKADSGTGSTLGGVGGSKDAVTVAHAHSVSDSGHNHTQNSHNHTQDAHGHGVSDPTHRHAPAPGDQLLKTAAGTPWNFVVDGTAGAGQEATGADFTAYSSTGVTVDNGTATNQAATAGNQSATTGLTVSSNGSSGTDANLPGFQVINYVIKT